MKNFNRSLFITLLALVITTGVVYGAEKIQFPYFQLLRYLYFIPILVSALSFDFAGTLYVSIIVSSLYVPIFFSQVEVQGFSSSSFEILITIFLFLLTGILIGKLIGNEKKKKELYRSLSEIGNIIAFSFDLNQLLFLSLRKILEITESSGCEIIFIDTEKKYFTIIDSQNRKMRTPNDSETILNFLIKIKGPFFSNNIKSDERFIVPEDSPLISLMACPIIVKEKVIGIIVVENKKEDKRYMKEDLDLLSNIANQLGASVSNLKLYELAVKDGLTQVYTHRFFQIKLKEELANGRTSLIIADIDHFKKVNDTYGHQEGDGVLRTIAKKISEIANSENIVCRYGGEEFGIILPRTEKEEAIKLAEKIRKEIADHKFVLKNKKTKITISLGVASANQIDVHPRKLIEEADQELYRAKETGRNKVCWKK